MKAIQFAEFGDHRVLKPVEVPMPVPEADQVLIEVASAGVNFVDIRERRGTYNQAETKVGGVSLPRTPGLQAMGKVVAVGPTGDAGLIGREVLALLSGGGYAQYALADPAMLVELPAGIDAHVMAALPLQGVTAYLTLTASTVLRPGESVLVHAAAGGVGSMAVQIARKLGAGKIIATAGTEAKRDLARRLGADAAVDYEAQDWTAQVLALTEGKGVDIILESIGGDVFEQNFDCLATFGRYVIYGSTRGPGKPFEPRRLMTKSQTMVGLYQPVFLARPDVIRAGLAFLVEHTLGGSIRPEIGAILPLDEASEAHRLLEARTVLGTVVLDPRAR
ncbi:MAG TPA: zinc-binding dehydrogenase [Stellaceae bacterium]|jgi:NADPH2:quinone reductase|nr:zinc-binding dehydrogenase [Stellaceae bacterium]